MENSRNKNLCFRLRDTVPSSVMKSHAVPLLPGGHMNHSFVQGIHAVYAPNTHTLAT